MSRSNSIPSSALPGLRNVARRLTTETAATVISGVMMDPCTIASVSPTHLSNT